MRDKITGLPIFEDFEEQIRKAMQSVADRKTDREIAIVATDFSNFKYLNRIYGFDAGDVVLKEFAQTVYGDSSHCISACRMYSDHIVGVYWVEDREKFVEAVSHINEQFASDRKKHFPLISMHLNTGIYFMEDMEEKVSVAIDKANIARKSMKGNHSIDCVLFTQELNTKNEEDAFVIPIFEEALEDNRILVLLQPKICVDTQKIIGAEALSRILDKEGNVLSAALFIPILEKSGRIIDLDQYVTKAVYRIIEQWQAEGREIVPISINLSRNHFFKEDVVETIIREFEEHNIDKSLIEFEITESVFFEQADILIQKIEKLREYGFKISVDDFGAGYSSLNLISILPVDIIKLDRGFIQNSLQTSKGKNIVKGLIEILNTVELQIVCEGVETREEERIIREYGCKHVQGFLHDRPIPIPLFQEKYLPVAQ